MTPVNKRTRFQTSALIAATVGATLLAGISPAIAAPLNLPKAPLFLNSAVNPNLVVTLDDSGSMTEASMPDSIIGNYCQPRWYYSGYNRLYYNPNIRYTPPLRSDGTPFPDSNFSAAWRDGYEGQPAATVTFAGGTSTVNLGTRYFPTRSYNTRAGAATGTQVGYAATCTGGNWTLPFASGTGTGTVATRFSSAFYYTYDGTTYTPVDVTTQSAAEQTNFANWYSYYRTRALMARTALTRVFGVQDQNMRVAWQNLWAKQLAVGTDPVVPFTGAGRNAFFQWLYRSPASGATPNRAAMLRVARMFQSGSPALDDLRNPYYEPPPLDRELTCRQNFHVHVTDGYTNETTNPVIPASAPARPANGLTLPDGTAYVAGNTQPESAIVWAANAPGTNCGGTCAPSLSDIAFAYWATDLRTDLVDNVPRYVPDRTTGLTGPAVAIPTIPYSNPEIFWNPANDPANWQHMVNFTVGLGVAGVRTFPTDYVSLRTSVATGTRWPGLINLNPAGVDDLWRAGVVSRGGYFSANDPQELVDSLSDTLGSVIVRRGTASAATVTSGIISTSTLAFRTGFDSGDWSGEVNAYTVEEDTGTLILPAEWEAGTVLMGRDLVGNPRQILTSSSATGGGIPFRWSSLPADYQAALNDDPATGLVDDDGLGERRVEYIRGNQGDEVDQGGPFRIRSKLLGAVVNSGAVVVAAPSAGYTDINFPVGSPERDAADLDPDAKYSKFRSDYRTRDRLIFVGGNDGMMHVFDAGSGYSGTLGTGEERWAYVPREVAPSLSALTNPNFEYTPFVDTTPVVRDVFIGDRWRTVLVGGLRRGGQGIFALDITDPDVTEADAANVVLWEFSDDHPTEPSAAQLGYTFGRPNISRIALDFAGDSGRWVVVLPGAYNNDAVDDVVGDGTSSLFVIDVETGTLIREFNLPGSKGLTTPTMGDYDDDFIDEFAVAGDLNGNLWRFDLSDPVASNWTVRKVFQPATDFEQPITAAPRLFADPATGGLIALFGTGKYLEPIDRTNIGVPTQSLYAVREQGATKTRSDLVEQTLTRTVVGTSSIFEVTDNDVPTSEGGWFIDFLDQGERDVTSAGALFSLGLAIVSTIIPNGDDPCLPGLRGNVYVLNAASGTSAQFGPLFDSNDDGVIGAGDSTTAVGSSVDSTVAEGSPAVLVGAGGGVGTLVDFPGIQIPQTVWRRRSWRDITPED